MKYYRLNKDWEPFKEGDKFKYDDERDGQCTLVSNDAVSACIPSDYLDELPGLSWEPKDGENYYHMNDSGNSRINTYYESSDYDRNRRSIGNFFKTREDAEAAIAWLKARQRLIESGARFINSRDAGTDRECFIVYFDVSGEKLTIEDILLNEHSVYQKRLYFDDRQLADRSIKEHRNDWLTYLGVNEKEKDNE